MNNSKIIICVFISAFMLTSCSELLQEQPKSFIEQEVYYTNQEQAVAGVNGVYSILARPNAYGMFYRLAEIPTDQGQTGGAYQPSEPTLTAMDNFTFNANNRFFDGVWRIFYNGINRANLAISKIPQIASMDDSDKNRLVAEVRFLRALYYFNLVRWFGGVPLVTSYTSNVANLEIPRADPNDVYQLIIDDLKFSVDHLPVSYSPGNEGRATRGAAMTLLGKVYLTLENWQNATETLRAVIDLNEYSLFPDYMDLWEDENENEREFIFSVQYEAGIINSQYSRRFAPRSSGIQASQSFGDIAPTPSFMNLFSSGDERLQVYKDQYEKYDNSGIVNFGHPFCFKYFDLAEGGNSGQNYPVLRYADVLLMYAEAKNELDGPGDGSTYSALWAINMVRDRAGIPLLTSAGYDQTMLRKEIWEERSRELAFEGHRWFDLVRTGRLIEVMSNTGAPVMDKHKLFPIPQREIDTNDNLVQNLGY